MYKNKNQYGFIIDEIEELDKVVHELYDVATNHEKLVAYNDAQDEFNEMFEYVLHIIQMSATGDDPDTIARPEQGGCSGDCGSCGGCDLLSDPAGLPQNEKSGKPRMKSAYRKSRGCSRDTTPATHG